MSLDEYVAGQQRVPRSAIRRYLDERPELCAELIEGRRKGVSIVTLRSYCIAEHGLDADRVSYQTFYAAMGDLTRRA